MPHRIQVVLADFDSHRAQATSRFLESQGLEVVFVDNGAEALERSKNLTPDVVILEALLPRRNGFEVLKGLKQDESTADVPVIMLLDEGDTYGENRARLCGADAILKRPFAPEELIEAARHAGQGIGSFSSDSDDELSEIEDVLEALENRARSENPLLAHITDPWTGLYNEGFTVIKLADEFKKARRFHMPLTCLVVSLDDEGALAGQEHRDTFKRYVNEFAGLLLCESRDIDHLARQGPLEFVALLSNTPSEGGIVMGERLLSSLEARDLPLPATGRKLTASAGVATFDGGDLENGDALLEQARDALRKSRQWGGNRVTAFPADTAAETKKTK